MTVWRWFHGPEGDVRLHRLLLAGWLAITVIAIPTGWINSVAFVAACSLYANAAVHWSALNAAKGELAAKENDR